MIIKESCCNNMGRPRKDPQVMIEDAFHAMSLAEQAATLRILSYIHRQAEKDAAGRRGDEAE